MAKRTNRVAWGLATVLSLVLATAVPVAAYLIYGVVDVDVTTTGLTITSIGEVPAPPEMRVWGEPVRPWPGLTSYACGTGGSRIIQVHRQGDVAKVVCHRIIFFPWRRQKL